VKRRPGRGIAGHLRDARDVLFLIGPDVDPRAVLEAVPGASSHALASPVPRPRERDAVVLVVRDLTHLRSAVTGVANFGSARQVGVWFQRPVRRLPITALHPEWPDADHVVASRSPESFVVVSFVERTQVRPILVEFARAAAPSGTLDVGWPAVGAERDRPASWPPADPSAKIALRSRLLDQSAELPPDVVLVNEMDGGATPVDDHPTLGRPTRVTVVEPDLTWAAWRSLSGEEATEALVRRGPGSLGPVDDQVVNPIGFDRDPSGAAATLRETGGGRLALVADDVARARALDAERGLSDVDMPALRALAGVGLAWTGGRGPQHYCRVVAELAAAGIPLVTDAVPSWAVHLLSPQLVSVLAAPVDLTDRLRREEHSIRLRRAALQDHGQRAWRRALAKSHGLQEVAQPRISVLLVTRRPGMLGFALRQLARQRWGSFEVVLATHGFDPDPAVLSTFREATSVPVTTMTVDSSVPFGQVLNAAAERANGDLLVKVDDDDWYSPDFLGDLKLAHDYSGAQLVGCPPEFTFIEPLWLTTRRATSTEVYRPFVAGGTLMMERGLFWSLGGFRHTLRSVDATLLSAVTAAGGRVFRTQGLGYVLRRAASGHTWDPGLGYFLAGERASDQWRGFRPSALLDPDPASLPERPSGSPDTIEVP
jgi:hypothetical protein